MTTRKVTEPVAKATPNLTLKLAEHAQIDEPWNLQVGTQEHDMFTMKPWNEDTTTVLGNSNLSHKNMVNFTISQEQSTSQTDC